MRHWKKLLEFRTLGQEDVPPSPKTMAVLRPEYKKAQLTRAGMWDAVWQLGGWRERPRDGCTDSWVCVDKSDTLVYTPTPTLPLGRDCPWHPTVRP